MPYAKKTFCEDPYQFLIETYCTQREQLPQRGDQIYEKYIKDNDANIPMDLKKRLDALKAHLANPPAPMRQEILNAWKAAHESSNSMFGSTLSPFVKTLDFKSPENDFLLHPDLQFGV
jgi:hypothetical protein